MSVNNNWSSIAKVWGRPNFFLSDSASFKTFVNVLKEKVIENIVKDKYSLISNIDSIINYSTYSSITVDAIFKQFGWDL